MLDYRALAKLFNQLELTPWWTELEPGIRQRFTADAHGDFSKWRAALAQLPAINGIELSADQDTVTLSSKRELSPAQLTQLETALRQLHPWRKGPFDFFGIHIDTEWRSDWKWQRVSPHISPLQGRQVLDIGCGSGYHLWRMSAEGAANVIGIEPSLLFTMQFLAFNHYVNSDTVFLLPIGVDDLAADCESFDTVFSMGVLYHRPSPIDHILSLKGFLRPGGELVLETLIIQDEKQNLLFPDDRYAQMRNVWFIPSITLLTDWIRRCGFKNVRVVDINQTSLEEQRSTPWMHFHSLADFLDPNDRQKTVEGYPAPVRAVVVAEK